jgi:serine/threonine protein kinase
MGMEVRFSMLEQQEYIGTYIGGYQLTAQLSAGPSSRTFLAKTVSLSDQQCVVVKWYHAVHLTTQQERKNFLHEANTLKRLQQPFILPILATGLLIDTPYIITPYMSKGSLYDRIRNPADRAWLQKYAFTIVKQIGQAIAYSHQQNVAHGKLHQRNILFNEYDEVQLVDFQLFSLPTATLATTNSSTDTKVKQKSKYHLRAISKANDQHALGSISYALLAGRQSSTYQALDSQDDRPAMTEKEAHLTPTSYEKETIAKAMKPEPAQHQSESSTVLQVQALDFPIDKFSSTTVLADEFSPNSAIESSTQVDASTALSCTDTYYSLQTVKIPLAPPPAIADGHRDTNQKLLPIRQQHSIQEYVIRKLLRNPGAVFLFSGIVCIIIFSIIGTRFSTTSHMHSSPGQNVPFSHSTTAELSTPQPTSSHIARKSRLAYRSTPIALLSSVTTPTTTQSCKKVKTRPKSCVLPQGRFPVARY